MFEAVTHVSSFLLATSAGSLEHQAPQSSPVGWQKCQVKASFPRGHNLKLGQFRWDMLSLFFFFLTGIYINIKNWEVVISCHNRKWRVHGHPQNLRRHTDLDFSNHQFRWPANQSVMSHLFYTHNLSIRPPTHPPVRSTAIRSIDREVHLLQEFQSSLAQLLRLEPPIVGLRPWTKTMCIFSIYIIIYIYIFAIQQLGTTACQRAWWYRWQFQVQLQRTSIYYFNWRPTNIATVCYNISHRHKQIAKPSPCVTLELWEVDVIGFHQSSSHIRNSVLKQHGMPWHPHLQNVLRKYAVGRFQVPRSVASRHSMFFASFVYLICWPGPSI